MKIDAYSAHKIAINAINTSPVLNVPHTMAVLCLPINSALNAKVQGACSATLTFTNAMNARLGLNLEMVSVENNKIIWKSLAIKFILEINQAIIITITPHKLLIARAVYKECKKIRMVTSILSLII
jgi:hypothetical protein